MILLNLKTYQFQNNDEHPLRNRSMILRIVVRIGLEIWSLMLITACPLILYCIYIFSHVYSYKENRFSELIAQKPDWVAEFALIWWVSLLTWGFIMIVPYVTAWIKNTRTLARRLTQRDTASSFTQDTRAPILYLRSFLDRYSGNDILAQSESDENLIFPVLKEVGPVIALGQPGETLPPLGASRIYLEQDCDWQATVREYLSRSKLVVISPGDSDGVIWETSKALQLCEPEKLIISLVSFWSEVEYSKDPREYQLFTEAIRTNTNFELPKSIDGSLFIYFDSARNPKTVKSDSKLTNPWLAAVAVRKVLTGFLRSILGVVRGWENLLPGFADQMARPDESRSRTRPPEITVRNSLYELLLTKGIRVRRRMPFEWYLATSYEILLVWVALLIPILFVFREVVRWLS